MNAALLDDIAFQLRDRGYAINNLTADHQHDEPALCARLHQRLMSLGEEDFSMAGTGRQQDYQKNRQIRRDRIHWLGESNPVEQLWLTEMASLQQHLNRSLLLGLFSYECHFAHYPPGAFYRKHSDAFRGQSNRILTTVFYLNEVWDQKDGGELLIYSADDPDKVVERVRPSGGTLVTFLSEEFPHEVLEARQHRYSIAGWFRVNNSLNGQLDPPR